MHDYSIDRHPKEKIIFALAFIAISAAPWINRLLVEVLDGVDASRAFHSGTLTAIPVFGLFIAIFFAFDKALWKIGFLRRFLLVPDLNGRYECLGRTVLRRGEPSDIRWQAEVSISQSWSKILIHLRTEQSSSVSVAASIRSIQGVGYRVLYQYDNAPNVDESELARHTGLVELEFKPDTNSATGNYFTDQYRQTSGTLSLRRISHATRPLK
jgi:hypothetical protein